MATVVILNNRASALKQLTLNTIGDWEKFANVASEKNIIQYNDFLCTSQILSDTENR